jgi:hypothetical protein
MKTPERGDLVWIDFDPQSGRRQWLFNTMQMQNLA